MDFYWILHPTNMKKPKYCNENWLDMTPTISGRTCHRCEKKIFDFTNHNWNQIAEIQNHNNNSLCGIYSNRQLKNWGQEPPSRFNIKPILAATAIIASMNQLSAQNIAPFDSLKPKTKINQNGINPQTLEKPDSSLRVITIQGKVTDESGENMPFAYVLLNQGKGEFYAITDRDGNYSIQYEPQSWNQTDTLIFSFVGCKQQEIIFETNRTNLEINCKLKYDDEIEFIAFYVKKPNIFRRTLWRINDLFRRKK